MIYIQYIYIYIKVPWFYHLIPSLYHGILTVKVEKGETDGERIFYSMNLEIKQEVEKRAGLWEREYINKWDKRQDSNEQNKKWCQSGVGNEGTRVKEGWEMGGV